MTARTARLLALEASIPEANSAFDHVILIGEDEVESDVLAARGIRSDARAFFIQLVGKDAQ